MRGDRRAADARIMTEITPSNLRLVHDAYRAFSRGDVDAVVAAMHPDIEWHEAEHSPWHVPGGHHGPTAVLTDVFARIPSAFERFEVHPSAFHDAGGTVIVEGRYRASAATTAEPLDVEVCHVWTLRDGMFVGFRQYTDTWRFAQVAGAPTA